MKNRKVIDDGWLSSIWRNSNLRLNNPRMRLINFGVQTYSKANQPSMLSLSLSLDLLLNPSFHEVAWVDHIVMPSPSYHYDTQRLLISWTCWSYIRSIPPQLDEDARWYVLESFGDPSFALDRSIWLALIKVYSHTLVDYHWGLGRVIEDGWLTLESRGSLNRLNPLARVARCYWTVAGTKPSSTSARFDIDVEILSIEIECPSSLEDWPS